MNLLVKWNSVTKEGLVTAMMISVAILRISCLLILQVDSEKV